MTIQGFGVFLRKRAPALFNAIAMDDMAGKRLGIDMHHKVYQMFFRNCGDKDRVMDDLSNFCDRLDKNCMDAKFVFDGSTKGLKPHAHKERKKAAERNVEIHAKVTEDLNAAKSACAAAEIHAETAMDLEAAKLRLSLKARAAADAGAKEALESQVAMVQSRIELEAKVARTELYVKRPDSDLFSRIRTSLVDRYGPEVVITAPDDAERWIAKEAACGNLDYAVSADYDTLAFGAPNLVIDFMHREKMRVLFLADVLEELKLTAAQFVDFAILSGCDYCGKVPGIGVKRAHAFVVKHGSIEAGWDVLEKKLKTEEDRDAFKFQFARDRFFHLDVTPLKRAKEPASKPRGDTCGDTGDVGVGDVKGGEKIPKDGESLDSRDGCHDAVATIFPSSPTILTPRNGVEAAVASVCNDKGDDKGDDDGNDDKGDDGGGDDGGGDEGGGDEGGEDGNGGDDGDDDVSIDMTKWAFGGH